MTEHPEAHVTLPGEEPPAHCRRPAHQGDRWRHHFPNGSHVDYRTQEAADACAATFGGTIEHLPPATR